MNLLVGLDALLEHRSVKDAAASLHLTPPAVSRILGRLRHSTGDAILVRDGRTMVPTPRALEIRDEVRDLVRRAEAVLAPMRELDLAQLDRTFTVRCHDALLARIAPRLVQDVVTSAPRARIRFVSESPTDDRELARGDVDLEVGGPPPADSGLNTREIGHDEMVLVVAEGGAHDAAHPSSEEVAAAPHVVISRRGRPRGPIDTVLENKHAVSRHVIATVPTVSAALAVVATGDAVTVLPRRLRDPLWPGLVVRPLPFPLESTPVVLNWHHRNDEDPAHRWLRVRAEAAVRGVLSE